MKSEKKNAVIYFCLFKIKCNKAFIQKSPFWSEENDPLEIVEMLKWI